MTPIRALCEDSGRRPAVQAFAESRARLRTPSRTATWAGRAAVNRPRHDVSAVCRPRATWCRSFRATTRRSGSAQAWQWAAWIRPAEPGGLFSPRQDASERPRPQAPRTHHHPRVHGAGDTRIAFGIGGWNQGQAHAQFASKHRTSMNARARWTRRASRRRFAGCDELRVARPRVDPRRPHVLGHQPVARRLLVDPHGLRQAVLRFRGSR